MNLNKYYVLITFKIYNINKNYALVINLDKYLRT